MDSNITVEGKAKAHISEDGDINLEIKLDKSWLVSSPASPLNHQWYQYNQYLTLGCRAETH
jgi:hypothetical protein